MNNEKRFYRGLNYKEELNMTLLWGLWNKEWEEMSYQYMLNTANMSKIDESIKTIITIAR